MPMHADGEAYSIQEVLGDHPRGFSKWSRNDGTGVGLCGTGLRATLPRYRTSAIARINRTA